MHGNVDVKMGSERNFGFVFAAVSAIIALAPLFRGHPPRVSFLILALAFAAVAIFAPGLLRWPNRLWFRFGMLLGAIVAPIVMTLVYVLTFLPMGLGLRLMGKDLLSLRTDPQASSYWINRSDPPKSMKLQY
ncbi:SxtJ family membrane protein [Paracoccus salipaludis]|nr:SxtJ family membrane protein [Paracoccus salipaludis]